MADALKQKKSEKKLERPDICDSRGNRIRYWDEEPETRKYRFVYNEQPKCNLTATRGMLYVDKNGKIKNESVSIDYMDGETYDMRVDIAKALNNLMVPDPQYVKQPDGQVRHVMKKRPRCTCIEV